jgi:rubrerythrin
VSSPLTVAQALEAAIAMEESVRGVFLSFAKRFRSAPGAAHFFQTLAQDESAHAKLWREIRDSLPAATLAEPASAALISALRIAKRLLARNPAADVVMFRDACYLTSAMENDELLAVFRALAVEAVPDAKRREFLELQIQEHLERVGQFVSRLGRPASGRLPPAAPEG